MINFKATLMALSGNAFFMGLRQNWKTRIVAPLVVLAVVCASVYGVCALRTKLAIRKAEAALLKGFGAVAADVIDERRHEAVRFEKGCPVMLGAYYQTRRADMLEWAGQACLEAGREIPEVFLALAAAREFTGRDQEALRILGGVAGRFDKIPDIYYRMAQILQRNKQNDAAAATLIRAAERAGNNNQIVLDAVQFLSGIQKWAEAKQLADKLKGTATDDPEVKLVLARALKNGGDAPGAQLLVDQAKGIIAAKPEFKQAIEQAYPDLLGGGTGGAAPSAAAPAPVAAVPPPDNRVSIPQQPTLGAGSATAPLQARPPAVTAPTPPAPAKKKARR